MPNPLAPADLLHSLHWRYATKQFDPARKLAPELWAALLEALRLAPSSFGLQPWKFIVVETPAVRQQLRAVSWGQTQVTDASHFVVLAAKQAVDAAHLDRFLAQTASERSQDVAALAGYRKMMEGFLGAVSAAGKIPAWSEKQVYLALGQIMTAAAALGVDTCPLEGIEPPKYDEILGLKNTGFATVCALAVGYRAATDQYAAARKIRFAAAEVVEQR
jgi:nitroreductase